MHGEVDKQESPADRNVPAYTGFPTSVALVGLRAALGLGAYCFGVSGAGVAGVVVSVAGGVADIAPVSAGGVAVASAGGGAAAGAAVSVLLQAESISATTAALRASFVFIDGSPRWYVDKPTRT